MLFLKSLYTLFTYKRLIIIIWNLKMLFLKTSFNSLLSVLFRFYITIVNRHFTKILKNLKFNFSLKSNYFNLNIEV